MYLTLARNRLGNLTPQQIRWTLALGTPLAIAPLWCSTMSWLPGNLGTVAGSVLLMLLAASTFTDLSQRKIFNWATYSAACWGLLINLSAGLCGNISALGAIGIRQSLLGFVACFVVMLFAYSLARGGAGDVKLAAGIGSLLGVQDGLLAVAVSYVVAGAVILCWSIWVQGPWKLIVAMGRFFGSLFLPLWIQPPTKSDRNLLQQPIPLAPFFALGTLLVVLDRV